MCIKNSLKCTFAVLLCVGVFFCYGFKVETEEVLLPEINSELNVEMEEDTETIEDVKVLDEDEKLEETENIEEKETEEVKDIEESEATEEEAKDVEEKEEATEEEAKDIEESEEIEEEAKDIEESEATEEEIKDVEESEETEEEAKDVEEKEEATEEEAKDVEESEATEEEAKDVEENEATEEEAKDIEESEATEETKDVEENKEQEFYIEDEETGIIIKAESGTIPVGTKILINRLDKMKDDNKSYENAIKNLDEDKAKRMERADFYSIDLVDDNNEEVQPNGNVEVMLPIPDDFDENDIKVFRVIEDEDIEYGKEIAVIKGIRYCSFKAEHFSVYCLYDRMRQHDYMEYAFPYTIATSVILLGIVGIALCNRKRNI